MSRFFRIEIGGELKRRRKRLDLNQAFIADLIKVSQTQYSKIERGVQPIYSDDLFLVLSFFKRMEGKEKIVRIGEKIFSLEDIPKD